MTKQTIGQRLRELREERGLSLRAAAEASGVGHMLIHAYEQGTRKPGHDNLRALLDAYAAKWAALD